MSEASIATSVPVPIARPEIRLRESGRVVDPVADHRHDLARVLEAAHLGDLVVRIDLRQHAVDPDLGRDALGQSRRIAGEEHGREVELPKRGDRLGARRLDGVDDRQRRPLRAVPRDRDRRRRARPTSTAWPSTVPTTPTPGTLRNSVTGGSSPSSRARSGRDGLRDRMLGRRLDRAREPEHVCTARTVRAASPRASSMRPSVTVPVLSSTTVVIRLVRSSTSGPLMRMPSWAPRPVPTMRAVGVASPSAQGQAMIRTATAAENASVASPVATSQPTSVARERASTIGTKTLETRSTSRWMGAFPDWASATSRAICASAVSSPTFVARTTSRPNVLTVAPATRVPDGDVDGNGLAREHRLVHRGLTLDDDAVGRDLLSWTDDEEVAGDELPDRQRDLDPVSQHPCLLRAELEQRADRRARAAPRACLEVATEQDERGDDGRDLEVDVGVVHDDECGDRPAPRRERSDRDERVHRHGAMTGVEERGTMEAEAGPEDDGRREHECDPLPAVELERRDHREHHERSRQCGGHDQSAADCVRAIQCWRAPPTRALPDTRRPRPRRRGPERSHARGRSEPSRARSRS